MEFSDFEHINLVRPSSSEELYLLSSGKAPSSTVVLINSFITNIGSAYKAEITEEIIEEWHRDAMNRKLPRALFLEEAQKALTGADGFTFELLYKYRKAQKLVLTNVVDIRNPKTILEVGLEEIQFAEGLSALSITGRNSLKLSRRSSVDSVASATLTKENTNLQKVLNNLIQQKARWEDHTYRAFAKVLNAKKRRIQELEDRLNDKPRAKVVLKSKKSRVIESGSDRSDQMNTSDENSNSSADYNQDTQVDEETMPSSPSSIRPDESKQERDGTNHKKISNISPRKYNNMAFLALEDSDSGSDTDFREDELSLVSSPRVGAEDKDKTEIQIPTKNSNSAIHDEEKTEMQKHSADTSNTGDELDDDLLLQEFCDI